MAFFNKGRPAGPTDALGSALGVAAVGPSAAECMRAGQVLVERGHLTAESLATSLSQANGDLLLFAEIVLGRFGVPRIDVATAVAEATGVPCADRAALDLSADTVALLPEAVVRQHCVIAIRDDGSSLTVLGADPTAGRRQAVEQAAGRRITWLAADPATVRSFIDRTYRADADVSRLVAVLEVTDEQAKIAAQVGEVSLDDQAPVIQLVNRLVSQAMRDRASDIHIEPLDETLRIRFRIDGHLVEAFSLPLGVHPALTSRLKIMSGMNIVEKRRPQDGQFSTVIDGKEVDVRVASVTTVFGEKLVMRILDKGRSMIGLAELGFPRETYQQYSKMIHSPFGMVICAGPTGAGKTTTLYASLLEIDSVEKNITTVEDPVEYVFPGINQIQTNDQAGMTFATGLKAILRQDPDVILVGEIRDADTARIAVPSALTGHLVLSSRHGTDA
ncbi:MAG: gspE, partial [Ilumatobacteraceae bacterium]|nr:gspE [Ilumatobacteraceae bacterium]